MDCLGERLWQKPVISFLVAIVFWIGCKKGGTDTANESSQVQLGPDKSSKQNTASFQLTFTNYAYTTSNTMQAAGSAAVDVPVLAASSPPVGSDGKFALQVSPSMVADLKAQSLSLLYFTDNGKVWNVSDTPQPWTTPGCFPFAMVRQDKSPVIFIADQGLLDIVQVTNRIRDAFDVLSCGRLCVTKDGQLTEVNNKSILDFGTFSNGNFADFLAHSEAGLHGFGRVVALGNTVKDALRVSSKAHPGSEVKLKPKKEEATLPESQHPPVDAQAITRSLDTNEVNELAIFLSQPRTKTPKTDLSEEDVYPPIQTGAAKAEEKYTASKSSGDIFGSGFPPIEGIHKSEGAFGSGFPPLK